MLFIQTKKITVLNQNPYFYHKLHNCNHIICSASGLFVCLFVCNRGDTIQWHGGLGSRKLSQAPMLLEFLTPRQVILVITSPILTGDRIEIVCLLGTLLLNDIFNPKHNLSFCPKSSSDNI